MQVRDAAAQQSSSVSAQMERMRCGNLRDPRCVVI